MSHRHNADNYFRKRWADGAEMFHRFIYRAREGPIPPGLEVDHLCNNRACSNPAHLQLVTRSAHASQSNRDRTGPRRGRRRAGR